MKKLFYVLTAVALLWGCDKQQNEILPTEKEEENVVTEIGELPEVLHVSMAAEEEGSETRTYIENQKIYWQNGDAISFFAGNTHNAKYSYNGEDSEASVELTKDAEIVGTTGSVLLKSQAVYPYNENITVEYDAEAGVDKINIVYPTTMKYGTSSFGKDANIMVAAGENNNDDNLHFRNACGYLVIKLYGVATNGNPTSIKNITLSSVSGVDMIAGSAVVVANAEEAPVITMVDGEATSVTLDCSNEGAGVALGEDAEHATEFWFCLPPVTFTDGIKITVTDVYDNSYTKQTSKTVNIERNMVQPMAALEFRSNAPAATKLWYTRSDGSTEALKFYDGKTNPFNANITKHAWDPAIGKIVIEFDAPLTTIQKEAFRGTKIATIELPEGVTTIEEGAFEKSNLTAITFPGSMSNIQVNAFYDCDKIESVTFLPSVTNTPLNICNMSYGSEWGPFYDSKLTYINLNRELVYVNKNGGNFSPDEDDEGLFYHENYDDVESVTVILGPQVKSVLHRMFNCLPIKSLTIPGSVTFIDNDAFAECDKITSIVFEEGIEPLTMGYNTLGNHDGPFVDSPLESIVLNREINYTFPGPDTANEGLFGGKATLVSVTLGEQVKTLSPYMFTGAAITAIDLNKVETISNNVFANTGITSLTIPGSVKSIGNNVFVGCTSLANVVFEPSLDGSSLTMGYYDSTDDDGPFYNCPLASVNLDREINYTFSNPNADNEGLFGGKNSLVSVTLGNQVKTLSNNMFADALITEIVIPGSVNTIGNDVFHQCTNLTKVTFEPSPSGTPLTIGYDTDGENENLFQDYSPLKTLVLNRQLVQTQTGVDTNSEGLFGGMPTLTSITLGEQVKTLSDFMFAGSSIEELVIPGTVTTIANDVFCGCKGLKTITFEPSATAEKLTIGFDTINIDESLFVDCPLVSVEINRELDYTLETIDVNYKGLFGGKSALTSVTLGDDVKTLSPYMFAGSGLTAINLNKVETIEKNALEGLALTSLTIPGGVNTIGNSVFAGCDKLVTITFEPSIDGKALAISPRGGYSPFFDSPLTTLDLNRELTYPIPGQNASGLFGAKKDLTKVTLGDQVKTLSPYMFAGSGLTSLDLNKVETIKDRALSMLALTSLTIPGNVMTIGNCVFVGCTALKELTFNPNDKGEALKIGFYEGAIDDAAPFYDCPLESVNLNRELDYDFGGATPDDATEGVFGGKNTLTSVILGSKVRSLSNFMFAEAGITTITIPGTLAEVSNDAFADCSTLTSLVFEQGIEPLTMGYNTVGDDDGPFVDSPLESIVLNRVIDYTFPGPDSANEGLFGGKSALTSVTLGDDVKTLLPYMFAKAGFATLNLNKVETIGSYALTNSAITNITIPATLTEICNHAFNGCSSLSSLVFESSATPLTMGFQKGIDERGPFYQSPLAFINLDRELVMNEDYAANCNEWDEGIFSNKYYDNEALTAQIYLGNNVKTILPYMFSTLRMEQLHLPKAVDKIGKNVVDRCNRLNAIVFYDDEVRPEVADNAFGNKETLQNYNYFLFMPRYSVDVRENGESLYYTDATDNGTYWHTLGEVMVDSSHEYIHQPHVHKGNGIYVQRYYDTENNKAKPGYEWYVARYCGQYDENTYVDITPPMAPAE